MDLVRIVEFGDHPHEKGLQRVNFDVARKLEDHFHSLAGLLRRRFGGLPVCGGHPDDPEYAGQPGHSDTRAHGWITELRARPDGLYGQIKWSKTGRELIDNANYKFFSPRWVMHPVGEGIYEPVRLLSLGLTNTPNIPGDVIANSAPVAALDESKVVAVGPSVNRAAEAVAPETGTVAANAPFLTPRVCSAELGARRECFGRRQAIVEAVQARMAGTGEDFSTAWSNLKKCRKDLF